MSQNNQGELQAALDSWTEACRSKDVARIMSHYDEGVVAYDAVGPLRFVGRPAYQAHWQACMEMCSGPGMFEPQEPSFIVEGDLGVIHYLLHCGGSNDKGELETCWMRVTQCLRRQGGRWLIFHEHFSAPFDMASGKTCFDLQP